MADSSATTISTRITGSFENPYFSFLFSFFFLENIEYFAVIYIYIYTLLSLSLSLIELLLSLRSRYINIVVSLTRVDADSIKSELNSIDVSIRLGCAASFFLRIKKKGGGREGKRKGTNNVVGRSREEIRFAARGFYRTTDFAREKKRLPSLGGRRSSTVNSSATS